jgi:hypothetical protein
MEMVLQVEIAILLTVLALYLAARRKLPGVPGDADALSGAHQSLHAATPPFNLQVARLTRARAEELLDWLEAHGHTGFRVSYEPLAGFVVHYP